MSARSARLSAILCVVLASCLQAPAGEPGELWAGPRCGAWVRHGAAEADDVVLVPDQHTAPLIVLPDGAPSAVRRAAQFLAADVERLTGVRPTFGGAPPANGPYIQLETAAPGSDPRWEAYTVTIGDGHIVIVGSNPRGTAFGVYELCERLGIDPLYLWTGITPPQTVPLVVRHLRFEQGPPTVKFRGLFHDDEDILPRPKNENRVPNGRGRVPLEWYERFFETALRLRLNMVAPWVRVEKPFEVQKTASDWGLYYTSHHYDTLLSDPYHFERGRLAEKRGVKPVWSWFDNRDGLIKYWRAGVQENAPLDCIYPVGMRGTEDYGYKFPEGWGEDQKIASFNEAFQLQVDLVKSIVPPERERLFHFTMYTEMLPYYQSGRLKVPEDVIIVWPDDNDGRMRGLPERPGNHRHGVYYHLAYYSGALTKQTHQVVPLPRIEHEFRAIQAAGATEFCLVNVSELREYVLGTRFIADVCWNGPAAFAQPDAAGRYLTWWCREYFGDQAVAAVPAYEAYFELLPEAHLLGYGAGKVLGAVPSLRKKLAGESFTPARPDTLPTLRQRALKQAALLKRLDEARAQMPDKQRQRFFFENLELAAAIDRLPTESAILLVTAMGEPDRARTLALCRAALPPLDALDLLLRRAERWPFDTWYGPSWIKERNQMLVTPREELIGLLREFGSTDDAP